MFACIGHACPNERWKPWRKSLFACARMPGRGTGPETRLNIGQSERGACIFPRYELCADCVTAKPLLRRLELHGPCITRGLLFTRNPLLPPPYVTGQYSTSINSRIPARCRYMGERCQRLRFRHESLFPAFDRANRNGRQARDGHLWARGPFTAFVRSITTSVVASAPTTPKSDLFNPIPGPGCARLI